MQEIELHSSKIQILPAVRLPASSSSFPEVAVGARPEVLCLAFGQIMRTIGQIIVSDGQILFSTGQIIVSDGLILLSIG